MDSGGGTQNCVFPNDFQGINGEPSTQQMGKYKSIFVYLSYESTGDDRCKLFEKDFDCGFWFVIPESPIGTLVALASPRAAFTTIKIIKKKKIQ